MNKVIEHAKKIKAGFAFDGEYDLGEVFQAMDDLIDEVDELEDTRETLSKQANGMIIVDDSEKIKRLEEARDCYKLASTSTPQLLSKKIFKLEAANAELKSLATTQKSMELTSIIKSHVDHGEKQLKEINELKDRLAAVCYDHDKDTTE